MLNLNGASNASIEFNNVTFGYTPDTKILKNLSFIVEPGKKVGIVGGSGSGYVNPWKATTSLANLAFSVLMQKIDHYKIGRASCRERV